mmetsp:Transcript_7042/g.14435  ORF Transcript_7042/g.14435 Transcript_7042/m.14435 type:complete len:216 (-) Transcript_7042:106-753(-)
MAHAVDEIDDGANTLNEDVQKLKTAWVAESVCPELLQHEGELLGDMLAMVKNQEEVLEHIDKSPEQVFSSSLYEMEINRVKFLIAKYLRTRLVKIERFAWKIATDDSFKEKLSESEATFAEKYAETMHKHFTESVLKHLPPEYQEFPDTKRAKSASEPDASPSLDTYVFCRVKPDVDEQIQLEDGGEHSQLTGGQVHVLRYEPVQALVGHQIDLI